MFPSDYYRPTQFDHSHFPGGDYFDYRKEDYWWSSPYNPFSTWRHFRPRKDVEQDLMEALKKCDKNSFASLMHQLQDSFSHYDNDYRWYPFHGAEPKHWPPGHIGGGLHQIAIKMLLTKLGLLVSDGGTCIIAIVSALQTFLEICISNFT